MSYNDYVKGTKFKNFAHISVVPGSTDVITKTGRWLSKYPILYAHTHDFLGAVQYLNKNYDKEFVLITHNSDGQVKDKDIGENDADVSLLPNNVVRWYAQNVMVSPTDFSKIVPLPIGLENEYCFEYDKALMLFGTLNSFDYSRQPYNLYYVNFNPHTYRKVRVPLYEQLRKHPLATIEYGQNGQDYAHFLHQVAGHLCTVAPRGNGLDTHRLWETLYLNRIPIVERTPSMETFSDVPIMFVDDWSELDDTHTIMERGLEISKRIMYGEYSKRSLSFQYWSNRIFAGD